MEIYAHRGYSIAYPENTLLAFNKAYEIGANGVELDVRLTKDGEVIVMHDNTVDRTTNGTGKVSELTLKEISKLDAGSWKGIAFENEPVPTLKKVLESLGHKTKLIIEFKNDKEQNPDYLVDQVVALIEETETMKNVIISSFEFKNLVTTKSRMPDLSTALILEKGISGFWDRHFFKHSINVDALHPSIGEVTEKLVRTEHLNHRKVRVWGVNESFDMMQMEKFGVDAIITDDPKLGLIYNLNQP